jgi:hypothetical protein
MTRPTSAVPETLIVDLSALVAYLAGTRPEFPRMPQ